MCQNPQAWPGSVLALLYWHFTKKTRQSNRRVKSVYATRYREDPWRQVYKHAMSVPGFMHQYVAHIQDGSLAMCKVR
jgi:hypothetical protein